MLVIFKIVFKIEFINFYIVGTDFFKRVLQYVLMAFRINILLQLHLE